MAHGWCNAAKHNYKNTAPFANTPFEEHRRQGRGSFRHADVNADGVTWVAGSAAGGIEPSAEANVACPEVSPGDFIVAESTMPGSTSNWCSVWQPLANNVKGVEEKEMEAVDCNVTNVVLTIGDQMTESLRQQLAPFTEYLERESAETHRVCTELRNSVNLNVSHSAGAGNNNDKIPAMEDG